MRVAIEATTSKPVVIPGGSGWAGVAKAGSTVTIFDVEGKQVGDLVLFRADDSTDRLSVGNSRKMANSIRISTGGVLWSNTYKELAQIEEDTVGRHDLLASACTPYDYPIRFGDRGIGHRSCLANLASALTPWGIPEFQIPDPMNVFMNQVIHEDGTTEVLEPLSRAGDYLKLRLLVDCIVGVSACPQDLTPCNGWKITDLKVEISSP